MSTQIDIKEILAERGRNYGEYADVAKCAQTIKWTLRSMPSWNKLLPFQQESLDMIANKLARIANGNPSYMDSWVDIAGYAKLVTDQFEKGDANGGDK